MRVKPSPACLLLTLALTGCNGGGTPDMSKTVQAPSEEVHKPSKRRPPIVRQKQTFEVRRKNVASPSVEFSK